MVLGRTSRPSRTDTKRKKKDVLFIIDDWDAKVWSQEIPEVTSKFDLRVQNETIQNEFCQESALVIANTSSNTRDDSTHGHPQMINTEIRLIIFSVAKDGEGLCHSVTQTCPTLCDPMGWSTPGFPILHYLPELAQTHVHWVSDVIQPSQILSSPSLPAFGLSQLQVLF